MMPKPIALRSLYLILYSSSVVACAAQLLAAVLGRDPVIIPATIFNLYLLLAVVPRNWA